MKPPFHSDGARYFYDAQNVRQCVGARMGRADLLPSDRNAPIRLRLVRVTGSNNGDYDKGGAYWGNLWRAPLYCAFGETDDEQFWLYVRAKNREEARKAILERLPEAVIRKTPTPSPDKQAQAINS